MSKLSAGMSETNPKGTVTSDSYFIIETTAIKATNVCRNKFTGAQVCAVVKSSAFVTEDRIELLEHDSVEKNDTVGDVNCSAQLTPDKMNYILSGDTLTFHDEVEGDLELKRQ